MDSACLVTQNFKDNSSRDYPYGEQIIIENNFMRVPRSIHRLKCPDKLDEDLAYLSGYHLGDGYLEDSNKTFERRRKAGYDIVYADRDLHQIELIGKIIYEEFGLKLNIYKRKNSDVYIGRANSCKVLHWFMNKKMGLPIGRKHHIAIPEWILKNEKFLANFISGFFDAEADISKTTNHAYKIIRIQFTQKDKFVIDNLKELLYSVFDIRSVVSKKWNQNAYQLHVLGKKNAVKFKEKIDFRNVIKRQKLECFLQDFK
ncbi:MAG: LAGLIDADG family homing endonuclease [Nanoarchaeota archaeon]